MQSKTLLSKYYCESVLRCFELLRISNRLGNAHFHSLISFNEIKTVRITSSFAKSSFIALGTRKSESESDSIEDTSGMSTDEGEEKRKEKGKKLVKHKEKKRERKGKGMHSEILPLPSFMKNRLNLIRLHKRTFRRHHEAIIKQLK